MGDLSAVVKVAMSDGWSSSSRTDDNEHRSYYIDSWGRKIPREHKHYMRSSSSNPWSTSPPLWEHPINLASQVPKVEKGDIHHGVCLVSMHALGRPSIAVQLFTVV